MESFASNVSQSFECPNGHGSYWVYGERCGGHTYIDDTGCPECGAHHDAPATPDLIGNEQDLLVWSEENAPICDECCADCLANGRRAVRVLQQVLWKGKPEAPMWLCLACGSLMGRDGSSCHLHASLWTDPRSGFPDDIRDRTIATLSYVALVLHHVPPSARFGLMVWGTERRLNSIRRQVLSCLAKQGIDYTEGDEVPHGNKPNHRGRCVVVGHRIASYGIPATGDWLDFEDAAGCLMAGPEPDVLLGEAARLLKQHAGAARERAMAAAEAQMQGYSPYNEGYYAGMQQGYENAIAYVQGIAARHSQHLDPLLPMDLILYDPKAGAITTEEGDRGKTAC